MRNFVCVLLVVLSQSSIAFENNKHFNTAKFNAFISELEILKNSSPKLAVDKVELSELKNFSELQQLEIIGLVFSAYVDQGNLQKAISLNNLQEKIASKKSLDEFKVKYWINKFVINITEGEQDEALKSITKAKDLARMAGITTLDPTILLYLGNYYRDISDYKEAKSYYNEALKLVVLNDIRAQLLNQLGSLHNRQGNPLLAINYLHEALAIHVENNNLTEVSNTYYNIAQTNFNMENFDLALKYYIETNRIDKDLGNSNNQAYSATNICSLYGWFGEFDKAEQKCDEAREIFIKQNSQRSIAWVNNSIGQSYLKKEQFIKLENLMLDTLEKYEQVTSKYVLIKSKALLVKAYIGSKKYLVAEAVALDIQAMAEKYKFSNFLENISLILSNIYLGLNDHESSIKYAHLYIKSTRESRNKVEDKRVERHKNSIEFITQERDLERQAHQTVLAEKALELKNEQLKLWSSIAMIIIILVLGFSYIVLQKRKLSLKEKELLDKIIHKKNQLLADVSHELRTPLTVLKMQIQSLEFNIENDKDLAYQALHRRIGEINRLIADIYELSRADAGDIELMLENIQPLQLLNDFSNDTQAIFSSVEGLSFTSKLALTEELTINVDKARFLQVLTNLVSNSRRYTNKPGSIVFKATVVDQELILMMEDSSPGVENDEFSRIFERLYRVDQSRSREHGGSGLGLAICKSLIEAQGGSISAKASQLGGLAILIRHPITKQ